MTPRDDEGMAAARSDRLRRVASCIVRDWAWQGIAAITADVSAVGRSVTESSTRDISRLPSPDCNAESDGLRKLVLIAEAVEGPPRRSWSLFRSRTVPEPMPMSALVAVIERERDEALRKSTMLQRDRLRLETADAAFEDALALIGLLEAGAAAVAREVASHDPTRAAMLRTEVGTVLATRRRDLHLQLLVLRQALATHDLLADGQRALADALDRARNVTIGAVHTAVAARHAVGRVVPSDDGDSGGASSLTDVVARLHAVLDLRERG